MNRNSRFPSTRWSVVLAARDSPSETSRAALGTLCRSYWYPLYSYVRRCGQSPADAQDITQGFLCQLLEKGWLREADRDAGRLRSFLIVAIKHYMRKQWRRARAQRRGGAHVHIPIDAELAESRYAIDPGASLAPESAYDRQWALTLLELTLDRLQRECRATGKDAFADCLEPCLLGDRGSIDYPAMAATLGMTPGAVRVAVHRLRRRFRQLYREELAQTLPAGADLDEEMHCLAEALANRAPPPCPDRGYDST